MASGADWQAGAFAQHLAQALDQRHMSLTSLRERLIARGTPVSLATLSYWRSGRREPEHRTSLEALAEVEAILGLAPGALSSLLVHRRRQAARRPIPFEAILRGDATGAETTEDHLDRTLIHLTVDLGPDGQAVRACSRTEWVATRAGVRTATVFYQPDQPGDPAPEVRAVAGCTVEAVERLGPELWAMRLAFDRALEVGESTITEVEVLGGPEGVPDTEYGLVAEQHMRECLVWVRFHPDRLPGQVRAWVREAGVDQEWPVDLAGLGVHVRLTDFGPGALALRWSWS